MSKIFNQDGVQFSIQMDECTMYKATRQTVTITVVQKTDLIPKTYKLSCSPIEAATTDALYQHLLNSLAEFGVDIEKATSMTTDSGSPYVSMGTRFFPNKHIRDLNHFISGFVTGDRVEVVLGKCHYVKLIIFFLAG